MGSRVMVLWFLGRRKASAVWRTSHERLAFYFLVVSFFSMNRIAPQCKTLLKNSLTLQGSSFSSSWFSKSLSQLTHWIHNSLSQLRFEVCKFCLKQCLFLIRNSTDNLHLFHHITLFQWFLLSLISVIREALDHLKSSVRR